jgi:MYXO-CTERM domain-containing protein
VVYCCFMVWRLGRGLLSALAFSGGLTTSLIVSVQEASACSPPPTGWRPNSVDPPPANGVLVLGFYCFSDCEPLPVPENLVLRDEADEVVPGSVVFVETDGPELRIAFRPEPGALTPANQVTAELEGVPPFTDILIGPEVTWSDALPLSDEILEVDYPTGETQCCPGPIDTCGSAPCFRTEVERRTAVDLRWGTDVSLESFQYVFRLTLDGSEPTPWMWHRGGTRFELEATEDSTCYVLELKRLVDDSVQTFASRCLERPATFSPGLHATPEEDVASVLATCDAPPAGYEGAWCEARRETCEGRTEEFCLSFVERCEMTGGAGAAGGPNVGGASGNGGTAGTAGTTSGRGGSSGAQGGTAGTHAMGGMTSTAAGAGGTAGDDGEAGGSGESGESGGRRVFTKGCGCAVPGNGSREPASLLLVALGFVALRRHRTAKRRAIARMPSFP